MAQLGTFHTACLAGVMITAHSPQPTFFGCGLWSESMETQFLQSCPTTKYTCVQDFHTQPQAQAEKSCIREAGKTR